MTRAKTTEHQHTRVVAVARAGRRWKEGRKSHLLPESMVVSECAECGELLPTSSEMDAILEWLDDVSPIAGATELSLNAKALGDGKRSVLGSWQLDWPRFKQVTTGPIARVSARRVEHTLRDGNRRVVAMRDTNGDRWLGAEVDREFGLRRWVFIRVTKFAWRALLEGVVTLDSTFADSDGEVEVIDYDGEGAMRRYATLPHRQLPSEAQRLGAIAPEKREELLATVLPADSKHRISFEGDQVSGHAITLSGLDAIVHPLKRMVQDQIERLTALMDHVAQPLFIPVPGSFALQVVEGEHVLDDVLASMRAVVRGADAQDQQTLLRYVNTNPAFISDLTSFFDGLRQSGLEAYLTSGNVRLHINPARARRVARSLESVREKITGEPFAVEGHLFGFDAYDSRTFTLISASKGTYKGRISRDIQDQYTSGKLSITMSSTALYRATLQPISKNNRQSFSLLSLEKCPDPGPDEKQPDRQTS